MSKPLAIDLFCGLGGWTEGLLAAGYDVIGFDNERHEYGEHRYPAQLVLQDVLTLHGSQFKSAALIVASPPCQRYSYMAMPWTRSRRLAEYYRASPERRQELNFLFDCCFRLQREATEAAGSHVPLVVENVKGAQPWVGRSRWHFGSFHLWGDVPALMPKAIARGIKNAGGSWFRVSHNQTEHTRGDAIKHTPHMTNPAEHGRKMPGIERGEVGFNVAAAQKYGHMVAGVKYKRSAEDKRNHIGAKRKFAAAMVAKIPLELSSWIGRAWLPLRLTA